MFDGQASKARQMLVWVIVSGPDRPLHPVPQIFGTRYGVVEGGRWITHLSLFQVFASEVPAKGTAFALTEYLGVGVQHLHQPGGARFLITHNEEYRRAFCGPIRRIRVTTRPTRGSLSRRDACPTVGIRRPPVAPTQGYPWHGNHI